MHAIVPCLIHFDACFVWIHFYVFFMIEQRHHHDSHVIDRSHLWIQLQFIFVMFVTRIAPKVTIYVVYDFLMTANAEWESQKLTHVYQVHFDSAAICCKHVSKVTRLTRMFLLNAIFQLIALLFEYKHLSNLTPFYDFLMTANTEWESQKLTNVQLYISNAIWQIDNSAICCKHLSKVTPLYDFLVTIKTLNASWICINW